MERTPEVRIADDGKHLLWSHECNFAGIHGSTWHANTPLPLHDVRGWRVAQADPLTVYPSIRCRSCGTRGYVRDGAWWVAA